MPPRKQPPTVPEAWRNRIVGHGEMTAEQIAANPRNPKIHGEAQRRAVSALLDDVGWVAPLVINRTTGLLLDGHMRLEEAATRGPMPVVFVELTEAEEAEVLALMDPIGAMAGHDQRTLTELIASIDTAVDINEVLAGMLPAADETEVAALRRPSNVRLKPLSRAHVLVSVDLEHWAALSALLDRIGAIPTAQVTSSVN